MTYETLRPHATGKTPSHHGISLIGKAVPILAVVVSMGLANSDAHAAGPKAGEFYLGFGASLFNPTFNISEEGLLRLGQEYCAKNTQSCSPSTGNQQLDLIITLPLGGGVIALPIPLDGVLRAPTADEQKAENRGVLGIGGGLGYQITDHFGAELHLELGFPNIALEGALITNLLNNESNSVDIKIRAPSVLPITVIGTYTFLPNKWVSPYVGIGPMFAILDNQFEVQSSVGNVSRLRGGVEIGYAIAGGVRIDLSRLGAAADEWFAYADLKYGRIDEPTLVDQNGTEVPVDNLEVRDIRVGVGVVF